MSRTERPLDPATSPVAHFAHQLRELRDRAGRPSYRTMQAKGFASYTSLSRAAGGRTLPTWPVVRQFVLACGGDPEEWKPRWDAAHAAAYPHRLLFRHTPPAPLPDPARIGTAQDLRAAVAAIFRDHDLGLVSVAMREPVSTVRLLSRRPELVDLPLFQRFLQACGATEPETTAWSTAWTAVRTALRHDTPGTPDPDGITTSDDLHSAIETLLCGTSITAIADALRTTPPNAGQLLADADRLPASVFRQVILACGIPITDLPGWINAHERVGHTRPHHHALVVATMLHSDSGSTVPATTTFAPPDPGRADSYDVLLGTLDELRDDAGVTTADIHTLSGGRLSAHRASMILNGITAATGEEFVLLLRACGLRDRIDPWITAWIRLNGPNLGRPAARPGGYRRHFRHLGSSIPVAIFTIMTVTGFLGLLGSLLSVLV